MPPSLRIWAWKAGVWKLNCGPAVSMLSTGLRPFSSGRSRRTDQECLVRLDSAHDAEENRKLLATTEKVRFIIKWNPRGSSVLSWRERVFGERRNQHAPAWQAGCPAGGR